MGKWQPLIGGEPGFDPVDKKGWEGMIGMGIDFSIGINFWLDFGDFSGFSNLIYTYGKLLKS